MTCQPRGYLTYDEKKSAEAAFQGLPFDPKWSPSARVVYDGIIKVLVFRIPCDATLAQPVDQAETVTCP
jgi:hypothetical protein